MNGSIVFGLIAPFNPTAPTGADNGLSMLGTLAQLGNAAGDPFNPANVTDDRAIPLDINDLEQAYITLQAVGAKIFTLINNFRSMSIGFTVDHVSPATEVSLNLKHSLNPVFDACITLLDQSIFPAIQIGYRSDLSTSFPVSKTLMFMGFSNLKNPCIADSAGTIAPDPQWSNVDCFSDPPAAGNHDAFLSDLASDGQHLTFYIEGNTGGTLTIQAQGADQIATPTGLAATLTGTSDGTFPSVQLIKFTGGASGSVWYVKSMHGTWA